MHGVHSTVGSIFALTLAAVKAKPPAPLTPGRLVRNILSMLPSETPS